MATIKRSYYGCGFVASHVAEVTGAQHNIIVRWLLSRFDELEVRTNKFVGRPLEILTRHDLLMHLTPNDMAKRITQINFDVEGSEELVLEYRMRFM